jgi:multidrug efflux pump
MIVVLAALGTRSALLVGFAIPTSFLLTFALFAALGVTVSNIVMFGLILAVGMLVDGAIVVVEYADKRIQEGTGPMTAYVAAAKRMFWPIVASTGTTLCAFLPLLLWPGVPGEFMGMLPFTLIFVLCASLVVALIYLPVMGGVSGRISRSFGYAADGLRRLPWVVRAALVPVAMYLLFLGAMQALNPGYLFGGTPPLDGNAAFLPGMVLFIVGAAATSITMNAASWHRGPRRVQAGYRRGFVGTVTALMVNNPVMPLVMIAAVIGFVIATFAYYGENNRGVEFFVDTDVENAIVYVRARGNMGLEDKDALVRQVEEVVLATPGVSSVFAFAGAGGLNTNTGGASAPLDAVGQVQLELTPWEDRRHDPELAGNAIIDRLQVELDRIPGIRTEILNQAQGPASGKPVHLRLKGDDWAAMTRAVEIARDRFQDTAGLIDIDDTLPLPGIDWQIDVDVQRAGRFGADVATVGGMVQLVTRGILLDTMRVDTSDDEIEIRVRLPEQDRVLTTLDSLKVQTTQGSVPMANFITREPVVKLGRIDRVDQQRYYDVRADVASGLTNDEGRPINATERIDHLTEWLQAEAELPAGITWEWTGDQEEQEESGTFLMKAFAGSLASCSSSCWRSSTASTTRCWCCWRWCCPPPGC